MSAGIKRSGAAGMLVLCLGLAAPASAQTPDARSVDAYYEAVGRYFEVNDSEIRILEEWGLGHDEIPVVLFIARRSGLSADAVAVARSRGEAWPAMVRRYGITTSALHVRFGSNQNLGLLGPLYSRLAQTARTSWNSVELSDEEVVTLVNVRMLSSELSLDPDRVLRAAQGSGSFVHTFQRLVSG